LDDDGKIIDIVNNYSKISFNFGPTLLSWMESEDPDAYQAILDADKLSQRQFSGHGSAIAQVYNHMIMPLANLNDKKTQVVWGIKDFERRFQRKPEGMWLAETAVDIETLEVLVEEGILFTILAPRQAKKIKEISSTNWEDVNEANINPKRAYKCLLPSGKDISIFFYDGPISQDVAFSGMLHKGELFSQRLIDAFDSELDGAQLIHIATDGETYGHHHRYGDMALAYALYNLEKNKHAQITIYGEYLEKFPPVYEVKIYEKTSWSCAHGVERWRDDCGCNSGGHPDWNQKWRKPLRDSLDWLRENLIKVFEEYTQRLLSDPWQARNDYFDLIQNRSEKNIATFLKRYSKKKLDKKEQVKVLKLMEMQRYAMLMYTSCGWFFDEISGIETIQIMNYAARAMQLAKELNGFALEDHFIAQLENAPSNNQKYTTGARLYELVVKPNILDFKRVAIHYGVSSLFTKHQEKVNIYTYEATSKSFVIELAGIHKLAIGTVTIRSQITWEEEDISFAILHLGDHNLIGGAGKYPGKEKFHNLYQDILESFSKSEIAGVIHLIDQNFTERSYSLWHLFKDEQSEILENIFSSTFNDVENSFRHIYEHHYPVMQSLGASNVNLPRYFVQVLEFIINSDISKVLESEDMDLDKLQSVVGESGQWHLDLNKKNLSYLASLKINEFSEVWAQNQKEISLMEKGVRFLKIIESLELDLNIWKAQNIYFGIGKKHIKNIKKQSDKESKKWLFLFDSLGKYLKVKIK